MGARRLRKVVPVLVLLIIFTLVSLTPSLTPPIFAAATSPPATQQPAQTQSATISGTDPLGVPEDPLGRQSEQQIPEISINVDVRDGHLIVRVVDVWGPGRVPLIVRSWTGVGNSPSGAGYWQFNHHINAVAKTDGTEGFKVLEPDGNLSTYRFLQENGTGSSRTWVYVKDVGTYSTLEAPVTCVWEQGEGAGSRWVCSLASGGMYTVYLPKGVIRRYSSGLISQSAGCQRQRDGLRIHVAPGTG